MTQQKKIKRLNPGEWAKCYKNRNLYKSAGVYISENTINLRQTHQHIENHPGETDIYTCEAKVDQNKPGRNG